MCSEEWCLMMHVLRRQLDLDAGSRICWLDCDCFMLMVCMAAPTESPGDDQRGVRGFARLEAGELEESQRTLLNVWNRVLT